MNLSDTFYSGEAMGALKQRIEWIPVLRKLGQLFFGVVPDPDMIKLAEVHKTCMNPKHFINNYLQLSKVKSMKKRKSSGPNVQTQSALQLISVLFMNGYLLNMLRTVPDEDRYRSVERVEYIRAIFKIVDPLWIENPTAALSKGSPIFPGIGYDFAICNFIKDTVGFMEVRKPRQRRQVNYNESVEIMEVPAQDFESMGQAILGLNQRMIDMENRVKERVLEQEHNLQRAFKDVYKRLRKIEGIPEKVSEIKGDIDYVCQILPDLERRLSSIEKLDQDAQLPESEKTTGDVEIAIESGGEYSDRDENTREKDDSEVGSCADGGSEKGNEDEEEIHEENATGP